MYYYYYNIVVDIYMDRHKLFDTFAKETPSFISNNRH